MIKVGRVNFSFAAAHHLPDHDGACKNLHGHNYKLEVEFRGVINPRNGMITDFKKIKDLVQKHIIDLLDHKCLNDVQLFGFPDRNPTAELMVEWMRDVIHCWQETEIGTYVALNKIKLWETDNCYVEWEDDYR